MASPGQRITFWIVICMTAVVVGLSLAQLIGIIDHIEMVAAAFMLLMAFIGLSSVFGWLPRKPE